MLKKINIMENKAIIYYILAITNMIIWVRLLKGDFLINSLIVVGLFFYADIISSGKIELERIKNVLFYFWIINIIFYIMGGLMGSIGIAIASLALLGKILYRALTSKFYKDSVNNIVKDIRSKRKK